MNPLATVIHENKRNAASAIAKSCAALD